MIAGIFGRISSNSSAFITAQEKNPVFIEMTKFSLFIKCVFIFAAAFMDAPHFSRVITGAYYLILNS